MEKEEILKLSSLIENKVILYDLPGINTTKEEPDQVAQVNLPDYHTLYGYTMQQAGWWSEAALLQPSSCPRHSNPMIQQKNYSLSLFFPFPVLSCLFCKLQFIKQDLSFKGIKEIKYQSALSQISIIKRLYSILTMLHILL